MGVTGVWLETLKVLGQCSISTLNVASTVHAFNMRVVLSMLYSSRVLSALKPNSPNIFFCRGSDGVAKRALERCPSPVAMSSLIFPRVFTVKMNLTLKNTS